jgi:hypothetical protein
MVNQMEESPELTSETSSIQSELDNKTLNTPLKLSEEPRTSSPEDKRFMFQTNSDSLNILDLNIQGIYNNYRKNLGTNNNIKYKI